MKRQNPIEIYFDESAQELLYSLVDRKNPNGIASGDDDTYMHTISAVFGLFASLLDENTPDLYPSEWQIIADSQRENAGAHRLPLTLLVLKSRLVVEVEDLADADDEISSGLLADKLAAFSSAQLCSIAVHVQRYHVARKRCSEYKFPEIKFKG
ncbi:hypothetical protein [Pseudomonas weihenstephanensis]|uniref:Uncharacterized protein n=1 Tax=Pseudomonas weihenstephanensis TaxID=1608994 RepID=A0ABS1ZJY3_9PSED|nr:hypothetical protein [Pseudomonas weihenstephanensis]MBM1196783.1 hypothetical protein [Pseudomonas weihenstephanensis]